MNGAHAHLLLNHLPILGIPIGLLFYAWAVRAQQAATVRFSLLFLIFAALSAVPVMLTGEPAEHVVKRLPGILKTAIHAHEDSASISLALSLLLGVSALVALVLKAKTLPRTVVAIVGLLTVGSFAYTGYLGGQIRHSEFVSDSNGAAGLSPQQSTATQPALGEGQYAGQDKRKTSKP